jgi:hypothetical protein
MASQGGFEQGDVRFAHGEPGGSHTKVDVGWDQVRGLNLGDGPIQSLR